MSEKDCEHTYRGQEGRVDSEHKCVKCGKVTLCSEVHPWQKDTWMPMDNEEDEIVKKALGSTLYEKYSNCALTDKEAILVVLCKILDRLEG